ncbi:hypothetical protein V8E52_008802 [Russula decolorans]
MTHIQKHFYSTLKDSDVIAGLAKMIARRTPPRVYMDPWAYNNTAEYGVVSNQIVRMSARTVVSLRRPRGVVQSPPNRVLHESTPDRRRYLYDILVRPSIPTVISSRRKPFSVIVPLIGPPVFLLVFLTLVVDNYGQRVSSKSGKPRGDPSSLHYVRPVGTSKKEQGMHSALSGLSTEALTRRRATI